MERSIIFTGADWTEQQKQDTEALLFVTTGRSEINTDEQWFSTSSRSGVSILKYSEHYVLF